MQNIKISVIICGYNEEELLPRALQSLLSQTLQEIEIILVDDASTDSTLKLMKNYEAEFPQKIKVIHNEKNLLLGGSRNRGLDIASGEYIAFCDCDDWVDAQMYEEMYNEAKKTNSDLCYCLCQKEFENGKSKFYKLNYYFPVGQINETQKKEILYKQVTIMCCNIYKRELFFNNNIRFPEHIRYEDLPISAILTPYISSYSSVNKPFYHYFIHYSSIVRTVNPTKYKDKISVNQLVINEFKNRNLYETYKSELQYLYFRKGYIHAAINYILNVDNPQKEILKEIKAQLLEVDANYRKNPFYKTRLFFVFIDYYINGIFPIKFLKKLIKFFKIDL